ncbi:hypothetical protein A2U01_0118756, partial [Trifolium medium]|nr:hypothetical protein [Trifolium medium]
MNNGGLLLLPPSLKVGFAEAILDLLGT